MPLAMATLLFYHLGSCNVYSTRIMFEVLTYKDDQGLRPYADWLGELAHRLAKN